MRTCESCRFWLRATWANPNFGRCRRYPPTSDLWVETGKNDWCGEHQPKDEEEK